FCSPCGFGWPFFAARSCHNCSQLDCWYFCTSRLAMASSIGYCCAVARGANSNAGTIANHKTCLIMICPRFFKAFSSDWMCKVREPVAHLGSQPSSFFLVAYLASYLVAYLGLTNCTTVFETESHHSSMIGLTESNVTTGSFDATRFSFSPV